MEKNRKITWIHKNTINLTSLNDSSIFEFMIFSKVSTLKWILPNIWSLFRCYNTPPWISVTRAYTNVYFELNGTEKKNCCVPAVIPKKQNFCGGFFWLTSCKIDALNWLYKNERCKNDWRIFFQFLGKVQAYHFNLMYVYPQFSECM